MSAQSNEPSIHPKRNTIGGVVGNVLEWYDFAVYGYFAPIIGAQFFPTENKLAALISAFGVFAAGYMMRPLGGMIFGQIGDRIGRKRALQISVLMMAIPTTLIGLLPTYASVGIWASVGLVALRLIQGVSVGGELIGSISFITEIAPRKRRGYYGSWTMVSAIAGVLLGSLMATVMTNMLDAATMSAWGWRLPFLVGILIGGFGLWMRKGMAESPDFEKIESTGEVSQSPVTEALRQHPAQIIHVGSMVMCLGGGFYMLFVWWPTYLNTIVDPPIAHSLLVNTISMVALSALIPFAGALSDRLGRKRVLIASHLAMVVVAWPLFYITDYSAVLAALACQLVFAFLMSGIEGPMPAAMVEMFPTKTRFSGVAIGYNVSLAVFGGTSPLVCTWLISATGDIAAPAYYLIAMAFIGFVAATRLQVAHGEELASSSLRKSSR